MVRHESAEVRRAQILDAALICFSEKGYHGASMEIIAKTAGLSKGALYWYFKNKNDLFIGLFDLFISETFDAWARIERSDVLTILMQQGELVLNRLLDSRALLEVWLEFLSHKEASEKMSMAYASSREMIAHLLLEGMQKGEIRTVDAMAFSGMFTGMIEGLLVQALLDSEFDPRPAWAAGFGVMARGLMPEDNQQGNPKPNVLSGNY